MPRPPCPWASETPEIQGQTARVADRAPPDRPADPLLIQRPHYIGQAQHPCSCKNCSHRLATANRPGPPGGGPDFSSGTHIIPHCARRRKTQRLQGEPHCGLTGTEAAHTLQLASPRAVRDRGPLLDSGPLESLPVGARLGATTETAFDQGYRYRALMPPQVLSSTGSGQSPTGQTPSPIVPFWNTQ